MRDSTPEPTHGAAPEPTHGDRSRRELLPGQSSRARVRAQYVVNEVKPRLRGWLHAVTFPLAVAAGIVLVSLAPTTQGRITAGVYALTSALLFGVSAVYHRGRWGPRGHARLKRFDHANIFLIIGGTYLPLTTLALHGTTRTVLVSTVSAGAVLGVLFRLFWVDAPRWLYTPLYILLGWAAAFVVPQLLHGAGVAAFTLVLVGGGLYTIGGVVYALRRPDPWPRWFGFHEVFHALTLAAFAVQFVAVSLVVLRAG